MRKPEPTSYKDALSKLRTSEDFPERTIRRLGLENGTNMAHTKQTDNGGANDMNTAHKTGTRRNRKLTAWTAGIAACAVLGLGIYAFNQNGAGTVPAPGGDVGIVESRPPADGGNGSVGSQRPAPPAAGKAVVNIDGIIEEVSADGNSFRIGELWVTVTDATEYGITGPTAPDPSEQLVSKEFKVGNAVSGFTSEDVSSGRVTAERIYNNF